MAVESIQSVREQIAFIDAKDREAVRQALITRGVGDREDEERAIQDRVRLRKEEDDAKAQRLAADLLEFDRNTGRDLQTRIDERSHDPAAERGALLDIEA